MNLGTGRTALALAALIVTPTIAAQSTDTLAGGGDWRAYFPLEVGNWWQFEYEHDLFGTVVGRGATELRVVGETTMSDTLYYVLRAACDTLLATEIDEGCNPSNVDTLFVRYDEDVRTVMLRINPYGPCRGSLFGDEFPLGVETDTLITSACGPDLTYLYMPNDEPVTIGGESYETTGFEVSISGVIPSDQRFARGIGLVFASGCEGGCWNRVLTYAQVGRDTFGTVRTLPARLHVAATSPVDGMTRVSADDVRYTFTAPLDTSATAAFMVRPPGEDPFAPRFLEQGRILSVALSPEPDRDFSLVLTGARGQDDEILAHPHVLRFTTSDAWGPRTVSGDVFAVVATSGGGSSPDPEDFVVALLTRESSPDLSMYRALTSEDVAAATTAREDFTWTMTNVRPGTYWPVALWDEDRDGDPDFVGAYGGWDPVEVSDADLEGIEMIVSLGGGSERPDRARGLVLSPPYPNPASGHVYMTVSLPNPAPATIEVFDVLGRSVSVLHDETWLPSGNHALTWRPSSAPSGIYFIRFSASGGTVARPVVVR